MNFTRKGLALVAGLSIGLAGLVSSPASANGYAADELVLSFEVTNASYDGVCIPLGTYQTARIGDQGNMNLAIDWGTGDGYQNHVFDGTTITLPAGISRVIDTDLSDNNLDVVYLKKDDVGVGTYEVKIKPNVGNGLTQYGTHTNYTGGGFTESVGGITVDCRSNLQSVEAWGNWVTVWDYAFDLADNLTAVPNSTPGNSPTSMAGMFHEATTFNGAIGNWDVSNVTDMNEMFQDAIAFNADIGPWDVSSVRDMSEMFEAASAFNQDIGSWDTSEVRDMAQMFKDMNSFNRDIDTSGSSWDVSKVTDMSEMFEDSLVFNQDLNNWNTSAVTDMTEMFFNAEKFDGEIGNWNVGSVTTMQAMFHDAEDFNQAIGSWNTGSVINMQDMFEGASAFNQDLNSWNTGNVTNMGRMFTDAIAFNGNVGSWNTRNVTNMSQIFSGATAFNQNIGSWDTRSATSMFRLFQNASSFNQYIGDWNTGQVTNMGSMFTGATAYTFCLPTPFFIAGETYTNIGFPAGYGDGCTVYVAPSAAAPYYGPIVRPLMEIPANAGEEVELKGFRMETVQRVTLGDQELAMTPVDNSTVTISLPSNLSGVISLNLHWVNGERSGKYRVTNAFDVNPVVEPEDISPAVSNKAVNAGTFKGVVAIYAKGYEGSRLSAKVGEDWVIVDSLESNYERIIERTRWIDHGMQVRIFIDRVLMATIPLRSE